MGANERKQTATKVAAVGIGINIALTAIKAVAGIITGSTAVVADAAHSASDIAATAIVYVGLRLGAAPADESHHYGHAKLESVAAKIVAIILIITGIGLGYNAIGLLLAGEIETPGALAIWVTILSIVVKEALYRYVHSIGRRLESTALMAEAWHHRSDAISSVAALFGVVGAILGYPALDPLAGIAVAGLIIHMGVKLYIQSIRELIDEAPKGEVVKEIRQVAGATPGVVEVNEIKARQHGPNVLVDLKICVNRFITVEEGHEIAGHAKRRILETVPRIENVLVHVNPCHNVNSINDQPECSVCQREKVGLRSREPYTVDTELDSIGPGNKVR